MILKITSQLLRLESITKDSTRNPSWFKKIIFFIMKFVNFCLRPIKSLLVKICINDYFQSLLDTADSARNLLSEVKKGNKKFPIEKCVRIVLENCNYDQSHVDDLKECLRALFKMTLHGRYEEENDDNSQINLPLPINNTRRLIIEMVSFIKNNTLYKNEININPELIMFNKKTIYDRTINVKYINLIKKHSIPFNKDGMNKLLTVK